MWGFNKPSNEWRGGELKIITYIAVGIVAISHLWFMILEMFLWTAPIGMKTFGTTPEFAEASAVLAANQGLYNGFLAAGIIWALLFKQTNALKFFLGCVVIAGVFGAVTAKLSILYVQALPAFVALVLVYLSKQKASTQ